MFARSVLYENLLLEMKRALYTLVQRVLSQGMSTTGVLTLFAIWAANKLAVPFMWSSQNENVTLFFMVSKE